MLGLDSTATAVLICSRPLLATAACDTTVCVRSFTDSSLVIKTKQYNTNYTGQVISKNLFTEGGEAPFQSFSQSSNICHINFNNYY